MQEWLSMTAADLGRGIGAGEIDPVALTDTFLQAIADSDVSDRIYARLTPMRARAEAAAAAERARLGVRRSPLDGVPISWKDLFDQSILPRLICKIIQADDRTGLLCQACRLARKYIGHHASVGHRRAVNFFQDDHNLHF